MAKRIFNKRVTAILLVLVMCFSNFQIVAHAAPARNNWSYAYYLGQEYLGNAAGAAVKPDPVGYGFQGVITDLTFTDDAGTSWTFVWSSVANGEWRITGSNVSQAKASAWPQITAGKVYVGYCNGSAYTFTLEADGSAADWTYVSTSSRHVNWFYYIRFIREYVVNVYYQNDTGSVLFNGLSYSAQEPLVRSFHFMYPNDNIIGDSEYEDGNYTDPVTLLPKDYLTADMVAQGYEIKYATDAYGNDVLTKGVTISLLGENVLNVYCTLVPPATENYAVVHQYYTEGAYDGSQNGDAIEVLQDSDFAQVVDGITKKTSFNGNTYGYVSYSVDPAKKVITLTYTRELPVYDYTLTYSSNFGSNPITKTDEENISGTKAVTHSFSVDANTFSFEGYTFVGWNTAPDGSGTDYSVGSTLTLNAQNNSEVLYAQWKENTKYNYSVIYNANYGTSPATKADAENISGTYASTYAIGVDANSFSRANYTFIGWATAPDGKVVYQAGDSISFTEGGSQILYAKWQENPKYDYSVTYDANFGVSPVTKSDSQNISGTYATEYTIGVDANSFSRANYTFVGWATSPKGEVVYQSGDEIHFTKGGSQTLYAQWIEHDKHSYGVIYNGNGGALSGGDLSYGDDENVSSVYATSHKVTVDENTFVRENFTFTGWNTEADGSGKDYAAEDVVSLTVKNNSVTLYAQWVENPRYDYIVNYDANFGTDPETKADAENITDTYATSHTVTVDENLFTRENYTFLGWSTTRDGAPSVLISSQLELTAENNEITLYAQWVENPKYDYSVNYDANFGADPETKADAENTTGIYDTAYTIRVDSNSFLREHYNFLGWNTRRDGTGTAYAAGSKIDLTAKNNSVTLYAQWEEHPKYDYSVTYSANFGADPETKADAENISGIYAASHTIGVDANGFARENYTFIGWNTKANGKGTFYAAGSKIFLTSDKNTAILYAQWIENPRYDYSVTYNANFGDDPETKADAENISGIYATAYSIGVDANGFVRENYTFIGWNTEADGSGKAYAHGDKVALASAASEAILYAQWIENEKFDYSVSYEANFKGAPEAKSDAENISGTYETSYTIGVDENTFVRENFTFIGWATTANGDVVYQAGDEIRFTEGGSQTLYAQWVEHNKYSYTVIYNGNGGALDDSTLAYGDSENIAQTYATSALVCVDENTFARENYTFIGWNTAADGSGTAYTADDIITLTAESNSLTLYAQWEENEKFDYSVTYEANFENAPEAKADAENITGIYETSYSITVDENSFERTGYAFSGWNTEADGSGTAYAAEDVIALTAENNSLTLYAQWTLVQYDYTVRYMVRVDGNAYAPFAGWLPENAPTGGTAPYGTTIDANYLENLPGSISDATYTYGFTALDAIIIPEGENVVVVYYTYITPQPPAPPAEEEPPVTPIDDDDLVDLPDEDVPLADVPKTGDGMLLYVGMTALSGFGLIRLGFKKKEEQENEEA